MKTRSCKLPALFAFGLLLIGVSLACFLWVRLEQRQYALDRQLINALWKNDTKQALVLVEAGADPNTREEPTPLPTLPSLIKQLLYPLPPKAHSSHTAFLIACGCGFDYPKGNDIPPEFEIPPPDPQLTQAMLLHGANVHVKDRDGATALHVRVVSALYGLAVEYNTNKEIIKQLLAYGADPNGEDNAWLGIFGRTPMKSALATSSFGAVPHPDILALLRKYSKCP